jgi:nuclear pore complex protein Nup133
LPCPDVFRSWHEIHQTAGITDEESTARFKDTALYYTVKATLSRDNMPDGYVLSPAKAAKLPPADALAARHEGAAPDLLEALMTDAQAEVNAVLAYGLEADFERAKEEAGKDIFA